LLLDAGQGENSADRFKIATCMTIFFYTVKNVDAYITRSYEHTYAQPISMSTSKKLSRFDLKIYKVGYKKRFAVDGDVTSH
jgi:hypothetical protein